jgi:nicotinate-nucleotide--dimethylbenzimidazole phosphoribosyltransferase
MAQARRRQDSLTKPRGSLGRLEELSVQVAGITGQAIPSAGSGQGPRLAHKVIVTMAGDHGVVAEGVSLYPQEVTPQMVFNFLRGGAGINVLARHIGARVVVVDIGVAAPLGPHPGLLSRKVAFGTRNMARGPALSREEAWKAIEVGLGVVEEESARGLDIVGTGDMGIGNTTPSAAIAAVFTGQPVARVTGRGTGLDDARLSQKVSVIERALQINRPDPKDPLEVLAKVGGLEIGGLAGVMLGAAARRIPVVIDGFISGAAALIAVALCPQLKGYLIAAHLSSEPGHRLVLEHLGLKPLLNLEMRLGEGTGAALGISLVEAATKLLAEMATFTEAGVSEAEES